MAKSNRKAKRPQARRKKSTASRHDKRSRLDTPNPQRRETTQAKFPLVGALAALVTPLSAALDARIAFRLGIIISGMILADDRRTASAWFAAAGVFDDWDRFYDCLVSIGRNSGKLSTEVLKLVATKFNPGPNGRFVVAVDDSPTKRYGSLVEGAGVHHHPTPGPADGDWLYGHNWVAIALVVAHRSWGTIALALRSLLYVREVDVPKLAEKYGWEFRTKHLLAVELVLWFESTIRSLGMTCQVWTVADGAYAARPFLDPLVAKGIVVVSRLRKDAALFDLPPARRPGQRGRPRIYGDRLSLAKRAGHPGGWQSITYDNRGAEATREYKTFVAKSRFVDGLIRVVIVRFEDGGWIPYFCTNTTAEVRDILEVAASRWAIEEHFHDVKEVWGAGEQQVRNVWSNIGCWNLNQWMYTLVELCLWDENKSELTDRSNRPWDNVDRRPSHADRRRRIAREMLRKAFPGTQLPTPEVEKFHAYAEALYTLCA
jgi:DDE superfamily endonuclease